MIYYESHGIWIFLNLFRCRGSVFGSSFCIAFPCALIGGFLSHFYPDASLSLFGGTAGITLESTAWSGFSFLVGFLVVFRTSQAYGRFWEGCAASYRMRTEWYDAISSVVAFTKHSCAPYDDIRRFKELIVRLTSMMHAAALAELEAGESRDVGELWAHSYQIIDPAGVDLKSIHTISQCKMRTELLFTWVQQVIVEHINMGILNIPAPLLSRSFQEMANGMVAFHDALRISFIPFPFPYAQACDCTLMFHWLLVPVVTSQWVTSPLWSSVFTFIQVFILWSLNLIATEIDHPFGRDINDIDGNRMQDELNTQLLLLLSRNVERTPRLSSNWCMTQHGLDVPICDISKYLKHKAEDQFPGRGSTSMSNFALFSATMSPTKSNGLHSSNAEGDSGGSDTDWNPVTSYGSELEPIGTGGRRPATLQELFYYTDERCATLGSTSTASFTNMASSESLEEPATLPPPMLLRGPSGALRVAPRRTASVESLRSGMSMVGLRSGSRRNSRAGSIASRNSRQSLVVDPIRRRSITGSIESVPAYRHHTSPSSGSSQVNRSCPGSPPVLEAAELATERSSPSTPRERKKGPRMRTPREPTMSNQHDVAPEPPHTARCPDCSQHLLFETSDIDEICSRCQHVRSFDDYAVCQTCRLEFCSSCIELQTALYGGSKRTSHSAIVCPDCHQSLTTPYTSENAAIISYVTCCKCRSQLDPQNSLACESCTKDYCPDCANFSMQHVSSLQTKPSSASCGSHVLPPLTSICEASQEL